jgi:hypothetical protein
MRKREGETPEKAMKKRRLLLFSLVALHVSMAHARPLKDFCEQFEPLRKISDLSYIRPRILVDLKTPGVKAQDVVFTIEAKAGVIKISPGAEGLIELPLTDKLCTENPSIESNQPPGSVSLGISIDPQIPPVRTLDYKLLESLRAQWSEAVSRQNLLWRALAPASKAYVISFEPGKPASAEIQLAGGARKIVADEKGDVRIPFEDAWVAANPTIVLSELPKKIGLAFK